MGLTASWASHIGNFKENLNKSVFLKEWPGQQREKPESERSVLLSPHLSLTALDELDCSFNEIEALPSSIGQCVHMRTFAADHNFLTHLPAEVRAAPARVRTATLAVPP